MKGSGNTALAGVCEAKFAVLCNVHMQWDARACVHGGNGVAGRI
jgi:hypothetical protein